MFDLTDAGIVAHANPSQRRANTAFMSTGSSFAAPVEARGVALRFGHQVGAALAAYGGGLLRVWLGTYHVAFTTAGLLALGAAVLVLTIRRGPVSTASAHQTLPASTLVALAEPKATTR